MFCSNCGQTLEEEAKFCMKCGTPIGVTIKKSNLSSQTPQAQVEKPIQSSLDQKKSTLDIVVIILCIFFCSIVIAAGIGTIVGGAFAVFFIFSSAAMLFTFIMLYRKKNILMLIFGIIALAMSLGVSIIATITTDW